MLFPEHATIASGQWASVKVIYSVCRHTAAFCASGSDPHVIYVVFAGDVLQCILAEACVLKVVKVVTE